jgi:protein SCO1/2
MKLLEYYKRAICLYQDKGIATTVVAKGAKISAFIAMLIIISAVSSFSQPVMERVERLDKINVEEHLGAKIPLDLTFTNDRGEIVPLSSYFGQGRPVVLVLAYYECPMLCTLVLNGLAKGVDELGWTPGKEYSLLTVSIDPTETAQLAASKKKNLLESIGMSGADPGWMFHVGEQSQITALADAVGFKYFYDEKIKQFAHPAVVTILSQDGMISRYLYGIEFKKQDLKLALLEASDGKIGNTIDKIILYCYHYDSASGGYTLLAANLMKLGGAITLFVMVIFLTILWIRERKRRDAHALAH